MLLHDVKDLPVQNLSGIEAQHEIQVVPVGNELVVHQVLDLGEEESSVPGVSQAVLPRVPDGRGHLHALHVVERRRYLRRWKRGFTKRGCCWDAANCALCEKNCYSLGMEWNQNWRFFILERRGTSIEMQHGLTCYILVS